MPTMLEVRGLTHRYGTGPGAHVAVEDLGFTVAQDELACIVGPSGCGKSTLLRCIAGLIRPSVGLINPAMHRSSVDLPHPDGPTMHASSSLATVKDRSSTATCAPGPVP